MGKLVVEKIKMCSHEFIPFGYTKMVGIYQTKDEMILDILSSEGKNTSIHYCFMEGMINRSGECGMLYWPISFSGMKAMRYCGNYLASASFGLCVALTEKRQHLPHLAGSFDYNNRSKQPIS